MKLNINYQPSKKMKVKIVSYFKNTKADNDMKKSNLMAANGRTVRYDGKTYLVRVATISDCTLVSAESMQGKEIINFDGKTQIAKDMKKLCENRLYS